MQRPPPRIVGNPSNAPALSSAYCIFFTKAMAMTGSAPDARVDARLGHQDPDRRRAARGVRPVLAGRRTAHRGRPGMIDAGR